MYAIRELRELHESNAGFSISYCCKCKSSSSTKASLFEIRHNKGKIGKKVSKTRFLSFFFFWYILYCTLWSDSYITYGFPLSYCTFLFSPPTSINSLINFYCLPLWLYRPWTMIKTQYWYGWSSLMQNVFSLMNYQ